MDLGTFRKGRTGFVIWIAGPALLVAAVYLPCRLYWQKVHKDCDRRMAIIQYMPEMNRATQSAVETLKKMTPLRGPEGDHGAGLNLQIQKMAQENGVGIRSLTPADDPNPDRKSGIPYLTVTLQGEGTLPAVVGLLDDMQRPEYLCRMEAVRMRVISWVPELMYSCDVVLRCYEVSNPAGG